MKSIRSGRRWVACAGLLMGSGFAALASPAAAAPTFADASTVRYAGTVACRDCPAARRPVPATIDLFADGTYTLRVEQRPTDSRVADEIGRWQRSRRR